MDKTKILIVDDHRMIIDGIAGLLQQQYITSAVASAAELDVALAVDSFDLALLDLNLGDGSAALDLLGKLREHGLRVIIMSGAATDDLLAACIKNGASGFIDKHRGSQEVLPAIECVLNGHMAFPAGVLSKLIDGGTSNIPNISDREKDVLNLMFMYPGITNEIIADTLSRSVGRIRNVATALFQKFMVLDRHELVVKAQRLGYYPSQLAQRELKALKDKQELRAMRAETEQQSNS